jgi:hypothetical protein
MRGLSAPNRCLDDEPDGCLNVRPQLLILSFTTSSAFLFETDQFLEHAQWFMASVNVIGELGAGLMAYPVGAFLGRLI